MTSDRANECNRPNLKTLTKIVRRFMWIWADEYIW